MFGGGQGGGSWPPPVAVFAYPVRLIWLPRCVQLKRISMLSKIPYARVIQRLQSFILFTINSGTAFLCLYFPLPMI